MQFSKFLLIYIYINTKLIRNPLEKRLTCVLGFFNSRASLDDITIPFPFMGFFNSRASLDDIAIPFPFMDDPLDVTSFEA
jgi:hypothetical protein